jgi:16S rRNA (cytosine1402-N4)-methyltransferase
MENEKYHIPVLLNEILELFGTVGEGIMIDGTLGGAGHSAALLEKNKGLRIIGIDKDSDALSFASVRLSPFADRIVLRKADFDEMKNIATEIAPDGVDGILLDLGVSSRQIDNKERGFSFSKDAPLDMRMNLNSAESASDFVNNREPADMIRVFREYGEENKARKIAEAISLKRTEKKIETTRELSEIIERVCGRDIKAKARIFQSIRIKINGEMDALDKVLETAPALLRSGGKMVVISYHSLEDRRVKQAFRSLTEFVDRGTNVLPGERLPTPPPFRLVTKKAIVPSENELASNSRSRSAKMRVIERI